MTNINFNVKVFDKDVKQSFIFPQGQFFLLVEDDTEDKPKSKNLLQLVQVAYNVYKLINILGGNREIDTELSRIDQEGSNIFIDLSSIFTNSTLFKDANLYPVEDIQITVNNIGTNLNEVEWQPF